MAIFALGPQLGLFLAFLLSDALTAIHLSLEPAGPDVDGWRGAEVTKTGFERPARGTARNRGRR